MHEVFGSTTATLLVALTACVSAKQNRPVAIQWLRNLLANYASDGHFHLNTGHLRDDESGRSGDSSEAENFCVELVQGKICLSEFAKASRCKRKNGRGLSLRKEQDLLTLLMAIRLRSGWQFLLGQLLQQVAVMVEANLHFESFQEGQAEFAEGFHRDPGQRIRNVRIAQERAFARRSKKKRETQEATPHTKLSQLAKATAKAQQVRAKMLLTRKDRTQERKLYFKSIQDIFRGANQIAMAFDASRVGGRKLTSYGLMELRSGLCAWGPSQASCLPKAISL